MFSLLSSSLSVSLVCVVGRSSLTLNTRILTGNTAWICGLFQLQLGKYSHHVHFKLSTPYHLNTGLGRNATDSVSKVVSVASSTPQVIEEKRSRSK